MTTISQKAILKDRTPAQLYSLAFGAGLVLTGVAGFMADTSFGHGSGAHAHTLLLFGVNGWHNCLHLGAGALGLAAFRSPRMARAFAIAWGTTAAVLAVWGSLTGYPVFGLIPADTGDNGLHLIDASLGILAWLASAPSHSPRIASPATNSPDRASRAQPARAR